MAKKFTHSMIITDPVVGQFVAFGCGKRGQKVYTIRESLKNIPGDPELEEVIRTLFNMEPSTFITLCKCRKDIDKQLKPNIN